MPAKFRVSITRAAENDIEQAWSFIAQDNVRRLNNQTIGPGLSPNCIVCPSRVGTSP
jgi:hypothetical protein